MGDGWSAETLATFVAAVVGAVVAAISVAATIVEARAARVRLTGEKHRDQWWDRWSWIAERAFSAHPEEQQAAMLLLDGLDGVDWRTEDDELMSAALLVAKQERR